MIIIKHELQRRAVIHIICMLVAWLSGVSDLAPYPWDDLLGFGKFKFSHRTFSTAKTFADHRGAPVTANKMRAQTRLLRLSHQHPRQPLNPCTFLK